jgi:hypothetical protein
MAYWWFVDGNLGVDEHDGTYSNYPDSIYGSLIGGGSGAMDTFLVLDTSWCWICDASNEVGCDTVSVSPGFGGKIEEDPPGADSLAMWPKNQNVAYDRGKVLTSRSLSEDNASEAFADGDSLVILKMSRETIVSLATATDEDTTWDYPIAVNLLDRHWCTGGADDPQLVKVTVDAMPGVFEDPVTLEIDSFYVRDALGMPNTALATNQNVLFVHKVTGIWSVPVDRSTLDPIGVFPTESRVGALSMRGLVTTARGHFFISYPGVFQFDGSSSTLISGELARFWRDSVSVENLAGASLVYDAQNDRLMASVPLLGSTVNNATLVYDFTVGMWTRYTYGMGTPALIRYAKPTPIVYFGSPDPLTGRVYRLGDVTLDDGGKFEALWRTGWLSLADLGHDVTVREWYAESWRDTTSDLVFNVYVNGSHTPAFSDTSTGTTAGWQMLRRPVEYIVRGHHVSFEFRSQADTLELSAGQVDYGDEGVIPWKD